MVNKVIDKNKPTIILSKCIGEAPCRYDGTMISNSFVKSLKDYVNFITVCPETGIGLPTPREALRLVQKENKNSLVVSNTGEDLTDNMNRFSTEFINDISSEDIHGAILKNRSPSCGNKDVKVYKDFGKSIQIPEKASGIFAEKLMESYMDIPVEDDGRLTNFNIREHFLTRVFTLYDFQKVQEKKSAKELIGFQSRYKYLLMAYSPSKQKKLGKIVAAARNNNINEALQEYKSLLVKALEVPSSTMRNVNMLLHLFGYFSKQLTQEEKIFFLDNLEKYQNKRVPFSLPLTIIKAWVIRFENEYLLSQKIFEAFPMELIEVTDSGKGI